MYMQMTWPALFARLSYFIDPTRLTYPNYLKDSKRFLNLMEETIQSTAAAQRDQSSRACTVIDFLRRQVNDDATDEEAKTEAFALLRAGNEQQLSLST